MAAANVFKDWLLGLTFCMSFLFFLFPARAKRADFPDYQPPFNIFAKGNGEHGKLPKAPPKAYKERVTGFSVQCGFRDKAMLHAIEEYLFLNGDYTIIPVGNLCSIVSNVYRLHVK